MENTVPTEKIVDFLAGRGVGPVGLDYDGVSCRCF